MQYPMRNPSMEEEPNNPSVFCAIDTDKSISCATSYDGDEWNLLILKLDRDTNLGYTMFLIITAILILIAISKYKNNNSKFWRFILSIYSLLVYIFLVYKISYFSEFLNQTKTDKVIILTKNPLNNPSIDIFRGLDMLLEGYLTMVLPMSILIPLKCKIQRSTELNPKVKKLSTIACNCMVLANFMMTLTFMFELINSKANAVYYYNYFSMVVQCFAIGTIKLLGLMTFLEFLYT